MIRGKRRYAVNATSSLCASSLGLSSPSSKVWLFDLDNTLHHASLKILPRVNLDMTAYVSKFLNLSDEQAQVIRKQYWRQYGATLTGMHRRHGVDPHDFLRETHRFPDMAQLVPFNPSLVNHLRRLPGYKVIFTNAPMDYARSVLKHSGLDKLADAVISIEHMQFRGQWQPKPSPSMLKRLLARLQIKAGRAVLIEDTVANLHGAYQCGVKGIWVRGMSYDKNHNPHRAGRGRKVSVQVQSVRQVRRLALN
jgi:putative hydrolase of the HAD superfamily